METDKIDRTCETDAVDLALARAALYDALAIGFRPPSEGAAERFAAGDDIAGLAEAAALINGGPHPQIVASLTALSEAVRADREDLSSQYRVLFGHTARGPVSPYETEYGNEAIFQQPQELSDLMGFYQAFHLTMKDNVHERPDHIGCECEFVSFLALKESYAMQHNDDEMLSETRKAERLFLRDHLARFAPTFAHGIQQRERDGFYRSMSELLQTVVGLDCRRLELRPAGANLELRRADDDSIPMACGSGGQCTAIPGTGAPDDGIL